jgi:hypothetical protein
MGVENLKEINAKFKENKNDLRSFLSSRMAS